MRIEARGQYADQVVPCPMFVYAYPEATDLVRAWYQSGATVGWETPGGGITFSGREHLPAVTVYLDEEGFRELGLVVDDTLARMAGGDAYSETMIRAPGPPEVPRWLVWLRWLGVAAFAFAIGLLAAYRFGWWAT